MSAEERIEQLFNALPRDSGDRILEGFDAGYGGLEVVFGSVQQSIRAAEYSPSGAPDQDQGPEGETRRQDTLSSAYCGVKPRDVEKLGKVLGDRHERS